MVWKGKYEAFEINFDKEASKVHSSVTTPEEIRNIFYKKKCILLGFANGG